MKKGTFLAMFVALVFVGCNKNQQAVKKLDGTWEATEMNVSDGGFTIDFVASGGSATFVFDGCKLKKDEWCNGSSTITLPDDFGGTTEESTFIFRVIDDGTILESKDDDTSSTTTMEIIELTKTNLTAEWTEDGFTNEIKAEKK